MPKTIAMIPARMGSQRLKKKNLRELDGVPLITRAIRKCKSAACFDEIWVNSEDTAFASIAAEEGVGFHQRPQELGDNNATSEQFVTEFLSHHDCEYIFQVHSITPLLSTDEVVAFTNAFVTSGHDVMLSAIPDQIEVAYKGQPVNFTFDEKTNSQDLTPVHRVTWSITGWKRNAFLEAVAKGKCATYSGSIGFFPVNSMAGHAIKTEVDLSIAQAYLNVMKER